MALACRQQRSKGEFPMRPNIADQLAANAEYTVSTLAISCFKQPANPLPEFILVTRHDITDLPHVSWPPIQGPEIVSTRGQYKFFVNGVQRKFVINRCHWIVVVNLRQRGVINSHFQRGFMMSFSQRDVMIISFTSTQGACVGVIFSNKNGWLALLREELACHHAVRLLPNTLHSHHHLQRQCFVAPFNSLLTLCGSLTFSA